MCKLKLTPLLIVFLKRNVGRELLLYSSDSAFRMYYSKCSALRFILRGRFALYVFSCGKAEAAVWQMSAALKSLNLCCWSLKSGFKLSV